MILFIFQMVMLLKNVKTLPFLSLVQESLLDRTSENGWNQLFDLIQTELYTRPDDVYVNIRLVKLYRSNNRLGDAVAHCQEAEKKISLQSNLEWCSCVVQTFKVCLLVFLQILKKIFCRKYSSIHSCFSLSKQIKIV